MKREIFCPDCAKKMEARQGDGSQYPGEHIKYVHGTAKQNNYVEGGISICDFCSAMLPPGSKCVAITMWSEYGSNPYWPWEEDFINVD